MITVAPTTGTGLLRGIERPTARTRRVRIGRVGIISHMEEDCRTVKTRQIDQR